MVEDGLADTLTPTVAPEYTDIVITFEVAGPDGQKSFEIIAQLT